VFSVTFIEFILTGTAEIQKQHREMMLYVEDMSIYTPKTSRKPTANNYNLTS
jgi:hypothetical protein